MSDTRAAVLPSHAYSSVPVAAAVAEKYKYVRKPQKPLGLLPVAPGTMSASSDGDPEPL